MSSVSISTSFMSSSYSSNLLSSLLLGHATGEVRGVLVEVGPRDWSKTALINRLAYLLGNSHRVETIQCPLSTSSVI